MKQAYRLFFCLLIICSLSSFEQSSAAVKKTFFLVQAPPPPPFISPFANVCINSPAVALTNGSPSGGIYTGPGVVGSFFSPLAAGVGTHTITYTIFTAGVPASVSATIKVSALPTPVITGNLQSCPDSSGPSQGGTAGSRCTLQGVKGYSMTTISVCENANELYSTINNAGSTYNWIASGGTVTSGQGTSSAVVQWGASGFGSLVLVETNAGGCSDTVGFCISIKTLPTANFTANNSCLGIANQFTNQSTGSVSWHWDFGDGTTSNQQHPNHIYASGGTYTVTLTVKNKCGCTDTITKTVTVNNSPGPKII